MVIGAVLFFGLIGYFTFIRPYFIYCKLPTVLAETDGKYVYFHGKKEAKIYYKIEAEEVSYKSENENNVSENEIFCLEISFFCEDIRILRQDLFHFLEESVKFF